MSKSAVETEFTPAEVEQFERDGYIILRGFTDAATRDAMLQVTRDGLRNETAPVEYEADLHYPGAPESLSATGGRTIRRLKQAHSRGYIFTDWLTRPALTHRLRQLLRDEVIVPLAHHNCIMTKNPRFSSDTGWHQDIRYWAFEKPELISIWLALGPEREENGCLWVIPGSHRMQFAPRQFDSELFFRSDLDENQPLIRTRQKAELEPGDVLFFHSRTLHAASRNFTTEPKFSVVFTVRPAWNHPLPGSRSAESPELLLHG